MIHLLLTMLFLCIASICHAQNNDNENQQDTTLSVTTYIAADMQQNNNKNDKKSTTTEKPKKHTPKQKRNKKSQHAMSIQVQENHMQHDDNYHEIDSTIVIAIIIILILIGCTIRIIKNAKPEQYYNAANNHHESKHGTHGNYGQAWLDAAQDKVKYAQEKQEEAYNKLMYAIVSQYGSEIANKIIAGNIWAGMPSWLLTVALGEPTEVKHIALGSRIIEKWRYNTFPAQSYKRQLVVTIENFYVTVWSEM